MSAKGPVDILSYGPPDESRRAPSPFLEYHESFDWPRVGFLLSLAALILFIAAAAVFGWQ